MQLRACKGSPLLQPYWHTVSLQWMRLAASCTWVLGDAPRFCRRKLICPKPRATLPKRGFWYFRGDTLPVPPQPQINPSSSCLLQGRSARSHPPANSTGPSLKAVYSGLNDYLYYTFRGFLYSISSRMDPKPYSAPHSLDPRGARWIMDLAVHGEPSVRCVTVRKFAATEIL